MITGRLATFLSILAAIVCSAHAEKVNMSSKQLRDTATHVVTATVAQIYERQETSPKWATTYYVAEIRVKTAEKGEDLKPGELLYVRYWRRKWVGDGPPEPSTSGHRGLPKQGDTLRIYLARDAYDGFYTTKDGGFTVIGANGFEALKE